MIIKVKQANEKQKRHRTMRFLDKITSPSFVTENAVLGDVHMLAAEKFCTAQVQFIEMFLLVYYKVGDTVVTPINMQG